MYIAEEHKDELYWAAVASDLLVMVDLDTKDVKVMLAETTDPKEAARALRRIADGLHADAEAIREMPSGPRSPLPDDDEKKADDRTAEKDSTQADRGLEDAADGGVRGQTIPVE